MNRIFDYISRIGKARGFGIQSPWAYSFVREVIFEKWPYYGYKDIDEKYNSRRDRKRQKLYLRLRNFIHGRNLMIIDMKSWDNVDGFSFFDDDSIGAVVIENLYYNKKAELLWEKIKQCDRVGITFDLYDLAICFPNGERYKQHYKMNF